MRDFFKRNKLLLLLCVMALCTTIIFAGCKSNGNSDNTDPNGGSPDTDSIAEKYISLGSKIREADRKLGKQLNDYAEDEELEYEYKFIRGPGQGNVSKSVPFLTLVDEVPEGAISAERSITLDFNHELYSYGFDGIDHRVTYNPMINDKWTLKNNSGKDVTVKAAYPFCSYNEYKDIYLDDGVRHSIPTFDVSGADADITYAVAPIRRYPFNSSFDPGEAIKQKLQSGEALKEALSDDWKTDDELIVYDIIIDKKAEDYEDDADKHVDFYFTFDSEQTFIFISQVMFPIEPIEPDLDAYVMRLDFNKQGQAHDRLVLIGEDIVSKGFIKLDESVLNRGEIVELPDEEYSIERSANSSEEYDGDLPVEIYRQWEGYKVQQSLINYFTAKNGADADDPLAQADISVSPLVFYIAEFTIPANGEVTLDISYMDRNAIYNFLCPDDQAYDLGKTDITVIKNDTMIIMDQNLGFETDGNKLKEAVSTVTFDTLKPGLYFEYRDYWAQS